MDYFALTLICLLVLAMVALILYSVYRIITDASTPAH